MTLEAADIAFHMPEFDMPGLNYLNDGKKNITSFGLRMKKKKKKFPSCILIFTLNSYTNF